VGHRRRPAGGAALVGLRRAQHLSFVALVAALHQPVPLPAEYLRALGNVFGVAAMIALHRGIRLFVGAPLSDAAYALALAVVLVVGVARPGAGARGACA
jgi:hypothetical protein